MQNKDSTRAYSDQHEKSVCKELGARQTPNSGGGKFIKGDVIHDEASLAIECKCSMTDKQSFSIKKSWIDEVREDAFRNRLANSCLCVKFSPKGENYYVIDSKLMKVLVDALQSEQ